jgi:NADH:ubiquinone oxidoreductase subunit E
MMVGEKVYGRVSPNDVRKILEEYREDNCEECKPTQQL